jgi:hypothetical protein
MTTLRRTTTPSAELDSTTGGRLTPLGLTTTTGLGRAPGTRAGSGVAPDATATAAMGSVSEPGTPTSTGMGESASGAGNSGCASARAASTAATTGAGGASTSGAGAATGAPLASRAADSPRAAKNATMCGSCPPWVSSLIIALWSCCIIVRTESSGAAGSYCCFFDERIVPSKNRCV